MRRFNLDRGQNAVNPYGQVHLVELGQPSHIGVIDYYQSIPSTICKPAALWSSFLAYSKQG